MNSSAMPPALNSRQRSNRRSRSETSSDEVDSSRISTDGAPRERAGDRDELALGDAERLDRRVEVQLAARPGRASSSATRSRRSRSGSDRPQQRVGAEHHVLEDAAGGSDEDLLEDRADPRLAAPRAGGGSPERSRPSTAMVPRSGRVTPDEQLDERALAAAVLAHHPHDRAGAQLDRGGGHGPRRAVGLREPVGPQQARAAAGGRAPGDRPVVHGSHRAPQVPLTGGPPCRWRSSRRGSPGSSTRPGRSTRSRAPMATCPPA